jgi:hypothetical protein
MADLLRDSDPKYLATDLLDKTQQMTAPFQQAANALAASVRKYRRHRWFGYPHLTQRIGALKDIKMSLLRMGREPCVDQARWNELKESVNTEFYFLDKLHRHRNQQDPQFTELLDAMDRSVGPTARRVTTIQGGKIHSSLRGGYILERLDPLHRKRKPEHALGTYLAFKNWISGNETRVPREVRDGSPWHQMMAFFLYWHDKDPSKTEVNPTYHGDKQRFFDALEFDGTTLPFLNQHTGKTTRKRLGKALAHYAFLPSGTGETKYERYNYRTHGKTRFPYQAPFHTVSKQRRGSHGSGKQWTSTVLFPENAQKARGFSETDAQLCWASLYVVVNDVFYVTHPDNFHSWTAGGANVSGAGLIAADNGKIVAIDNASGHYAPDWRQLRQSVQVVANNGAFTDSAVVGLGYKYSTPSGNEGLYAAVLRWMDFLRLCHVIRDKRSRTQVWENITSQYPPLPTMAGQASGTLDVHVRIWNKFKLSWEKVGKDLFAYLDNR